VENKKKKAKETLTRHSKATVRGMRRYWKKKKQLWYFNYLNALKRIRKGDLSLSELNRVTKRKLISKQQAEKLRKKLKG